MAPKAPKPPDPQETAEAQYKYSKEAAHDSALYNQMGQVNPFGRIWYTGEIGSPNRVQHSELAPGFAGHLNQWLGIKDQLLGIATGQPYTPTNYFPSSGGGAGTGAAQVPQQQAPVVQPWEGDLYQAVTKTKTKGGKGGGDTVEYTAYEPFKGNPLAGQSYFTKEGGAYRPLTTQELYGGAPGGTPTTTTTSQLPPGWIGGEPTSGEPVPFTGTGLLDQLRQSWGKALDFSGHQQVTLPGQQLDFSGLDPVRKYDSSGFQNVRDYDSSGFNPLIGYEKAGFSGFKEYDPSQFRGVTMYDALRAGDRLGPALNPFGLSSREELYNTEPGSAIKSVEDATFNRYRRLLDPLQERQREQQDATLLAQGIVGSQGARAASQQLSTDQNRAFQDAADAAVLAGRKEHQRLEDLVSRNRGQRFGEEQFGLQFDAGERQAHFGRDLTFRQQQSSEAATASAIRLARRQQQAAEAAHASRVALANRQQLALEQESAIRRDLALRGLQGQEATTATTTDLAIRNQLTGEQQMKLLEAEQNFAKEMALRQQQIQESLVVRQQPMTDLSQILNAAPPPGLPQFTPYAPTNIQAPNYQGAVGQQYQGQVAAHNAQQAAKGQLLGSLGGAAIPFAF